MPSRRAVAIGAVDTEHRGAPLKRRQRRVWLWVAHQARERFMTGVIQMLLPTEKDHFVFEERFAQETNHRRREVTRYAKAADLCTDISSDRKYLQCTLHTLVGHLTILDLPTQRGFFRHLSSSNKFSA